MMNWIEWIPAIANVVAYGVGQLIGHRQGSSIRPQAAQVITEVAKTVADSLATGGHESLGEASEEAAGEAARASSAAVTPRLPAPPKGPTI